MRLLGESFGNQDFGDKHRLVPHRGRWRSSSRVPLFRSDKLFRFGLGPFLRPLAKAHLTGTSEARSRTRRGLWTRTAKTRFMGYGRKNFVADISVHLVAYSFNYERYTWAALATSFDGNEAGLLEHTQSSGLRAPMCITLAFRMEHRDLSELHTFADIAHAHRRSSPTNRAYIYWPLTSSYLPR